jgi:hypothetical protein
VNDQIIYFAHLSDVMVKPGSFIKAGSRDRHSGAERQKRLSAKVSHSLTSYGAEGQRDKLVPFDYMDSLPQKNKVPLSGPLIDAGIKYR